MQTYTTRQYKASTTAIKMSNIDLLTTNDLKDIPLKLRALINATKLSDAAFATTVGLTPEQISRYLKGKITPTIKTLEKIKEVYPDFDYVNRDTSTDDNYDGPTVKAIPMVYGFSHKRYAKLHNDEVFIEGLPKRPFYFETNPKGKYVAIQVTSDNMDDGSIDSYRPNDVVLGRNIDPSYWTNKLHINKWDFILVHKHEEILMVRIKDHDPVTGRLITHNLNPFFSDTEINIADVSQILNIIKIERDK